MLRFVVCAICIGLVPITAAEAGGMTAAQIVERQVVVESPDGATEVTYEPAASAMPGDTIRYKMSYANAGTAAAENIVLVVPVPAEVRYIENSASGSGASAAFSADGGKSFAPRGDLKVSVDGVVRAALAEEITHIRWSMQRPMAAAESGELSFEAVLR